MTHNPEEKQFLPFAIEIAKKAGKVLLDFQKQKRNLDPTWKSPTNFKTAADDASDTLICNAIHKRFPEHAIYSEESGVFAKSSSEYLWIVDALDGTLGFTSDITDHFTVSIGLARGKKPIMGVLYAPKRKSLYAAYEGLGATCNGEPISVSFVEDINKVMMGIDSGKKKGMRASHLPYFRKLMRNDGITCAFTTACATVPLALVAEGRMHAYLATALEPEDMTAAVCIIREAGGKVTNLSGKNWEIDDMSILAANPVLHRKLMRFLAKRIKTKK